LGAGLRQSSKKELQIIEEEEDAYHKTLKSTDQIEKYMQEAEAINNDTSSSLFNMNDDEEADNFKG
jgi:hypothetical protein